MLSPSGLSDSIAVARFVLLGTSDEFVAIESFCFGFRPAFVVESFSGVVLGVLVPHPLVLVPSWLPSNLSLAPIPVDAFESFWCYSWPLQRAGCRDVLQRQIGCRILESFPGVGLCAIKSLASGWPWRRIGAVVQYAVESFPGDGLGILVPFWLVLAPDCFQFSGVGSVAASSDLSLATGWGCCS